MSHLTLTGEERNLAIQQCSHDKDQGRLTESEARGRPE